MQFVSLTTGRAAILGAILGSARPENRARLMQWNGFW
jgi:hypothetical protein